MDRLREFLQAVRTHGATRRNFRGLLHVLIGRRISLTDGTVVSGGMTWRLLAGLLRDLRWEPEAVRELGLDPATLPPRDRQRYWYGAIAGADVAGQQATAAGDRLAEAVQPLGYIVGPAPGAAAPAPKKGDRGAGKKPRKKKEGGK
jgi:hypothetical protein